jgi:carboxymethylenebutenolidase
LTAFSEDIQVDIPDASAMGGYMATPSQPNGSALVVLQEIFGLNPYVRGVVDHFADAGFVAIAPDLFWRQAPGIQLDASVESDRERATALMHGLDTEEALIDARAALGFAQRGLDQAGPTFAVGYCLGGKIAFLLAARGLVDTAVSYYGVGIHAVLGEASGINGRVLLHVAQEDHLCPPQAQAEIASATSALGERAQLISYPGAGHAFARPGGSSFNADAAESADRATMAFLQGGLSASASPT